MNTVAVGAFPPKNDYLWITWSILLSCNYNCRYCHVRSEGVSCKNTINNVIRFIKDAPQKTKEVTLFGGEPTIHPNLEYIVDGLSKICNKIHVFTNLSCRKEMISYLVKNNVSFSISYHPDIISPEKFIDKLKYLYDNNGNIDFINVMMVHEKEEDIEYVAKICRELKIRHRLLPIWQEGGQSDWVKSVIYSRRNDVIPIRDTFVIDSSGTTNIFSEQECIYLEKVNFKGWYCYGGMRSLYINHKGIVYRCQADMRDNIPYANCNTDAYPVLEPYICPHEKCTCEYYIPKEISLGICDEYIK